MNRKAVADTDLESRDATLFDPTIYENIKVVLEGAVYDMDLSGSLVVTNRTDRVELSSMSRFYAIQFRQPKASSLAEISLHAPMGDLAAEILEKSSELPGCILEIIFTVDIQEPEAECPIIQRELAKIWDYRPQIEQRLAYSFGAEPLLFQNRIRLHFGRKVDEGQIGDVPDLVHYTMESLAYLNSR